MLERVDFNQAKPEKQAYKQRWEALMERLVVLQQQAVSAQAGLVVLFEGWNGAGKGSRISDLMYNLDARATSVYVSPDVDPKEVRDFAGRRLGVEGYQPLMEEYWRVLGERGSITFYDRGWYTKAMQLMMARSAPEVLLPSAKARHYLASICDFERQLSCDGYTVVKFFVHVSKKAQRRRLERLHDDEATRWRVPERKLASARDYDEAAELYDRLLEGSSFDFAPWVLVNGEDKRSANLLIAETLVEALEGALAAKERARARADASASELKVRADERYEQLRGSAAVPRPGAAAPTDQELRAQAQAAAQHSFAPASSRFPIVEGYPTVASMDPGLVLPREEYKHELKRLQRELFRLENLMYQARVPLLVMYEGWDAAGKGGNIKRVAQALDARAYTIYPSPAPTKPELAHPHLWRYWTRLPKAGHVGLYDRSWYGRVLVERVEEITPPERWAQGYDEINEFEHDLVDWGAILLKFWVDVSPSEQLARFEAREADPAKHWKITPDDWRNRDKYPQYKSAIDDMFRLTSTTHAPWTVLESDDKRYARVKALRIIVEALEERLG